MTSPAVHYDLVVVGGGVAGWTAARRAQQLGASVVVLEKTHAGFGFGNGRLSGGVYHAAYLDPRRSPDDLMDAILASSHGHSRPELAKAWANNVGRAFAFLQAEGAVFGPEGDEEFMQNVLQPPREAAIGRHFAGSGPDRLLSTMWRSFLDDGGTFLPAHRVVDLDVRGGVVQGVIAHAPTGNITVAGRAVLLADGGFQGNPELVRTYITTDYKLRGSPHDTGDALRMGLALGATAVNMEWFYGAPLCKDAINDDRLWPYPTPSGLIAHGVLVDAFGHRFVDESIGPEYVADAIAKCRTPGDCWVIVDELTWETVGREGGAPINPTLQEAGGTVLSADNVADLAKATRLPEAALRETVDAFSFRSTTLFALPVIAGITFAMGGLLVDETARVLHRDGHPIAGLYAAGGAMGGLQGGPLSKGYTGGWSEASTFGLLAAEHAVENGDGP